MLYHQHLKGNLSHSSLFSVVCVMLQCWMFTLNVAKVSNNEDNIWKSSCETKVQHADGAGLLCSHLVTFYQQHQLLYFLTAGGLQQTFGRLSQSEESGLLRRPELILPVSVRGSTQGLDNRQFEIKDFFGTVNHTKL